MHLSFIATETVKPESADVTIQCDLLATPPLEMLAPQQSFNDFFTTEATITKQDDACDLDLSITSSQQGYTTEYG